MVELKEFQERTLDDLKVYLAALLEEEKKLEEVNKALVKSGKEPMDFVGEAWKAIGKEKALYQKRIDGVGRSIPNICLKVPTGGGKTLLGTHAVKLINYHYFRRNTGLVLWIMPSEAICTQTEKSFLNTEHIYRQVLDQAAPAKRTAIFGYKKQKSSRIFSRHDIENNFSVMLRMLQATNTKNTDTRKMFQDSGQYIDFFPDSDDYKANQELYQKIPNLDVYKKSNMKIEGTEAIAIKNSLANVFRVVRPIIVIDEGHKAYSAQAREILNNFNPRFILELSATPNQNEHMSNILSNVSGTELKKEQMIKLPIQLKNISGGDWEITLSDASERIRELDKSAHKHRENTGKYIRPIMVVRVERTGSDKRGKGHIHSEDAREYLIEKCGFREDEVRVKSGSTGGKNEIADEDLMSHECPVRAIITKSALQEGWDCPFAYVLALLDSGKASTSLTQMIGRVLRQPYAQTTGIEDLDNAHVFCFNQNVGEAVKKVHSGLGKEGLESYQGSKIKIEDSEATSEQQTLFRRERFKEIDDEIPMVLHKTKTGARPLSYERDILANIVWGDLKVSDQGILLEKGQQIARTRIDLDKDETDASREVMHGKIGVTFFARHLADVVPNPWQAMRMAEEVMPKLQGCETDKYNNRIYLVEQMKKSICEQKEEKSQKLFNEKLRKNEIIFRLNTKNSGWKLPASITVKDPDNLKYLARESNAPMEKTFIENYEEQDFNKFERKVACYLDEAEAIEWWHRVISRTEYGLQGWRKHLVYPDFIAFISHEGDYLLLETKGKHLEGNQDTNYKKVLFDILEQAQDRGEVEAKKGQQIIRLKMLFECGWRERLQELGINR